MTRNLVYELGSFLPIHKPSQRPHSVNVTISALANDVQVFDWLAAFQTDYSQFNLNNPNEYFIVKLAAQGYLGKRGVDWIIASGLRPVSATMNTATGSDSTIELSFTGSSLQF